MARTVNRGGTIKNNPRPSTGIQSIEVGMALLKLLADAPRPMALSTLSAAAGMPRSQAHKYLTSLMRAGLVVQANPGEPYDLGPQALNLGLAAMRRLDVIAMGQESLDALRDRLDQTATMAVWANRGPTIVRWAETPEISSPTVQLGTVFPVLTSTLGLVFAAYLDRRFTEPFIRSELSERMGAASRMGLRRMSDVDTLLTRIRKDGMVAGNSIVAPGVASICAPVFQRGNTLAAAIAVAGIQGQLDLSLTAEPAQALAQTCLQLSARLGARDLTTR